MKTSRIMLALIPLAFAQPALAQGTEEQRAACGSDAFRLCASSIPNVGKIAACLRERRDALSAACRTVLDAGSAAKQPRTAEAPPPPARPAPPRLAERPKATPRVARAPEPAPVARTRPTERAAPPQAATPRLVERRTPRARLADRYTPRGAPAYSARAARPQIATRRPRGGRGYNSDMAEAMYWMRTVTGYASSFDAGSLGSFAGLLQ